VGNIFHKRASRPLIRPQVQAVAPYQPGMRIDEAERQIGPRKFAKLASNENLFGPSPRVREALLAHLDDVNLYPDPLCRILRARFSWDLGVSPDRLLFGNGSEQLIEIIMQATLTDEDQILISSPTFPLYAIFATAIGAEIIDVPRRPDMMLDIEATVDALARIPKILFLCNPNNPTGTAIAAADFERIARAANPATLIVVDEAYYEYTDKNAFPDSIAILSALKKPHIVLRTFSKAYGLAGLRLGYGIASSGPLAELIGRIRPQFSVNSLAQAAAFAAWEDRAYLDEVVQSTVEGRRVLENALRTLGLAPFRSEANFLFYEATGLGANSVDQLLAEGVIVRPIRFDGRDFHRLSVGRPEDNVRALNALKRLYRPSVSRSLALAS
jgi:histidinol-phosphate aminotransferase